MITTYGPRTSLAEIAKDCLLEQGVYSPTKKEIDEAARKIVAANKDKFVGDKTVACKSIISVACKPVPNNSGTKTLDACLQPAKAENDLAPIPAMGIQAQYGLGERIEIFRSNRVLIVCCKNGMMFFENRKLIEIRTRGVSIPCDVIEKSRRCGLFLSAHRAEGGGLFFHFQRGHVEVVEPRSPPRGEGKRKDFLGRMLRICIDERCERRHKTRRGEVVCARGSDGFDECKDVKESN